MPELPEVTITAERLDRKSRGWLIVKIKELKKLSTRHNGLAKIKKYIPLEIKSVKNRGKQIYFDVFTENKSSYRILNHMNLHGFWTVDQQDDYTRTIITLQKGEKKRKLYYNDQTANGNMDFHTIKESNKILENIAPSIFDGFTNKQFIKKIVKFPRRMVFSVIMDQHCVLSGVGNYIANESLYRAKIAPRCHVGNIPKKTLLKLYEAIEYISCDSYNYHRKKGGSAYHSYQKYMLVYKKKKDAKGYKVRNDKVAGRTTHWVKEIQTIV